MRRVAMTAAALCLGLPTAVVAVSTRSFVVDSSDDFKAGELQGAAVHSDGRLTRGVRTEPVLLPGVPVAYSSARGGKGAIFVGTGNEGKVFRVRGDKADTYAKTDSALVASLVEKGGTLYAGTLPDGKIFKIEGKDKVSELCQLKDVQHVWALRFNAKGDRLYAGTGPEGKIFEIDLKGKARELYDSDAEHVLSLATDGDKLFAGLSNGAKVLRVDRKGAQVVADLDGEEVTALDAANGALAAAANTFPDPPRVPDDPSKGGAARIKRPGKGSGKLFHIDADGRSRMLFESAKAHLSAVQLDGEAVFVGLGQKGRILRVEADTTHAVWADADERQVVSLQLTDKKPYFVTSDAVSVHRVTQPGASGEWTSAVLDAGFQARWGELAPRHDGAIEFATRSGNTEKPDDTWSPWSAPLTKSAPIRSPAARFLQVRAKVSAKATLHALHAYYLPQNQQARVHSVRVKPSKAKDKDKRPKYAPPKASSTYKLTWDVNNPDEDVLRYRLHFRREGQKQWRPLLREHEELRKAEYAWDTRAVPDGFYRIKVEASDELANPAVYALRQSALSPPLRIDNHAPRVLKLKAKGNKLSGQAVDSLGPIAALEIAVDGEPFRPLLPRDDLLDTAEEAFDVDLSALSAGTHIVAIRATDASGNTGSAEIELRGKP